ncbi:hypothetical protein ABIC45_001057 [Mucilaginibacter rubeus]|uniref:hypothetical protein n=1 Tax=Mucilaginibacter rubeus TaxID=2027860 RepID=UPI0033990ADE
MTKMTPVWMLLSAVITSHIFFAMNFDEKSKLYFGKLPEWTVYSIPLGYAIVIVWGAIEQLNEEKKDKINKANRI